LGRAGKARRLATVTATGWLRAIEMTAPSGFTDIDDAALKWGIGGARDIPGRVGDEPTEGQTEFVTRFAVDP
jgi:hypothetical protein